MSMVDTGSQSMVVSRSLLYEVLRNMERERRADVTADVKVIFLVDERSIITPVFVQPDSKQECLLGSNILSAIGITVTRANGEPLTTSMVDEPATSAPETAHVNLRHKCA